MPESTGRWTVSVTFADPLAAGRHEIVRVDGAVPFSATPFSATTLSLSSVLVDGTVAAGDRVVQINVLPGDLSLSNDYSLVDATLIGNRALGADLALPGLGHIDVDILADLNLDGRTSSIDRFIMLRHVFGNVRPEIPALPPAPPAPAVTLTTSLPDSGAVASESATGSADAGIRTFAAASVVTAPSESTADDPATTLTVPDEADRRTRAERWYWQFGPNDELREDIVTPLRTAQQTLLSSVGEDDAREPRQLRTWIRTPDGTFVRADDAPAATPPAPITTLRPAGAASGDTVEPATSAEPVAKIKIDRFRDGLGGDANAERERVRGLLLERLEAKRAERTLTFERMADDFGVDAETPEHQT